MGSSATPLARIRKIACIFLWARKGSFKMNSLEVFPRSRNSPFKEICSSARLPSISPSITVIRVWIALKAVEESCACSLDSRGIS